MIALNFEQIINDWLMPRLQNPNLINFILAVNKPLISMYNDIVNQYNQFKELYTHNCQILSLEHLLNTQIIITGKPIVLTDGLSLPYYYYVQDTPYIRNGFGKLIYTENPVLNITDINDYTSTSYQPFHILLGGTSGLYLGGGNKTNYQNLVVKMDLVDYNDIAKQKDVISLLKLFLPVGTTYTIKSY